MHDALRALNRIQSDGVIGMYAIGSAIGATYYLEAFPTEDIDVFVFLPPPESDSGLLFSLTPIYDALKALGGVVEKEYIRFGTWPVQILTDANPLIAEAIRDAAPVDFDGIPTKVFTAEHLCAVALQTGRPRIYCVRRCSSTRTPSTATGCYPSPGVTTCASACGPRLCPTHESTKTSRMSDADRAKAEFNRRAKARLRADLRNKTWPEKIAAVERLNALQQTIRAARVPVRR